jgi:hypothetical protein
VVALSTSVHVFWVISVGEVVKLEISFPSDPYPRNPRYGVDGPYRTRYTIPTGVWICNR